MLNPYVIETSRPVSWSKATLQQLRRSVTSTKSSQSSKEDVEALNRKHGYDQIKDEKGMWDMLSSRAVQSLGG